MTYFYSDEGGRSDFDPARMARVKPLGAWLKHYDNLMFLCLITENGTSVEKFQAGKEIKICLRKMDYWYPRVDLREAEPEIVKLKAKWERQGDVLALARKLSAA